MELRIVGAQLEVTRDIAVNRTRILKAIEFAHEQEADILLTPEGSLSGYTHQFDVNQAKESLQQVTARARERHVGLALGTCFVEQDDGKCYNQIRFYSPEGEYLGFHSKTLTCSSLEDPPQGEINHYAVSPLRTFLFQGVPIGGLICNDLWANPGCTPGPDPHLTQQLAGMGAKVIFHAVNGGRSASEWSQVAWHYHESNLRMRANAGQLWIVTVDNCHPTDLRCSAPSGVVDPKGNWVCRAKEQGEAYFTHTIQV